jgi:uncharacterized protein (DUF885 family)
MPESADPTARLHEIFQDEWQAHLRNDPLFATITGDTRYNDRLPLATEEEYARQATELQGFLDRLDQIPQDRLSPTDRVNADAFRRLKEAALREIEFGGHRMPVDRMGGYYSFIAELPTFMRLAAVRDYEDYLARLAAFPKYNDGQMGLMREGLRLGMTQPRIALDGILDGMEQLAGTDPERSVFFEPLSRLPEGFPGADRDRLRTEGRRIIEASVLPAYRSLIKFMSDTYLPGARTTTAAADLPNGDRYYEHRVQMFLSLPTSAKTVHEIGLEEVQRIREEMSAIRRKVGFTGDHAAFGESLRTDPRFYVPTADQLMKEVALILKRMDGELPRLFRVLPRLPYGIKPVPDHVAPQTTTAYYWEGAGDGSRAGFYYVNTYDLKSRPLYELEALSLHEAVPGHHLQIALQQELTDLPEFRRFESFTAFTEGWGLYAERLGLEAGFYTDPYSDYGRLTYEMWRACRLVVDTGMHAFGWSRDRGIAFVMENTALTERNVRNEIDRYLTMPGQALAYKMGELKIRELRQRAEKRLGDQFDVRAFHDVVLRQGAIPLDALEATVDSWLAGER